MSVSEIMHVITERNKDPVIAKLIEGLMAKLPQELVEAVDAEKHGWSLVLAKIPAPDPALRKYSFVKV